MSKLNNNYVYQFKKNFNIVLVKFVKVNGVLFVMERRGSCQSTANSLFDCYDFYFAINPTFE